MRDFDEMSQLFSQMDRMFETMQDGRMFGAPAGRPFDMYDGELESSMRSTPALEGARDGWTGGLPTRRTRDDRTIGRAGMTNLVEEDGEYVFVMDLPGYETDEIDLVFREGVLHIRASTELTEDTETTSVRHSRSTNETVSIPGEIDVENVDASYHNGVLEVTLPRLEADSDDEHVIDLR